MRWVCLLTIVVFICISPAIGMEVVLEQKDGDYLLVYTSPTHITISGYTVQLDFDQKDAIINVQSVEPFDLFAYHDTGDGVLRISGITAKQYPPATSIPLARISARYPFNPIITIESLRDYNLNVLVGQENEVVPSDPLGEESRPSSTPDVKPVVTVPPEVRVPWTFPESELIEGTVTPKSPAGVIERNETNQGEIPQISDAASPLIEEENNVSEQSESHGGMEDTTIPKTPISVLTVIAGLIIVMFIKRSRV